MSKTPSRTIELLRTAVSSGAYAEAQSLLGEYRGEMQARWEAATSAEQRDSVAAEVAELLEWARIATLAARAHAQRKLIHLTRATAYTACSRRTPPQLSEIRR
jgi:hypothetical protein